VCKRNFSVEKFGCTRTPKPASHSQPRNPLHASASHFLSGRSHWFMTNPLSIWPFSACIAQLHFTEFKPQNKNRQSNISWKGDVCRYADC